MSQVEALPPTQVIPTMEQLAVLARSLEFSLQVKLEAEVDIRLLKMKMEEYSVLLEGNGESLPMKLQRLWTKLEEWEKAEERTERNKDRSNERLVAMISIIPSILSMIGGFLGYVIGKAILG